MARVKLTITSLLASVFVFLLTSMVSSTAVTIKKGNDISYEAEDTLSNFVRAYSEIWNILSTMQSLGYRKCDENNINEMNKAVLISGSIKDISFIENGVQRCTTGKGWIPSYLRDYEESNFDSKDGLKIWTNVESTVLNNKLSSTVIKLGNYLVAIDSKSISKLISRNFSWEVILTSKTDLTYFNGVKIFEHKDELSHPGYFTESKIINYVKCINGSSFCLVARNKNSYFGRIFDLSNPYILTLSLILSLFTLVLLRDYEDKKESIVSRVKSAIRENNFYCTYQPIVELETMKVVGVEVLARLRDNYGVMKPDDFIPVIMELGNTWDFTCMMLSKSLDELSSISTIDESFMLNVNVFASDISNHEIINIHRLPSVKNFRGKIVLEITESEYLDDKTSQNHISQLRDKGITVVIDDFGSGYSNFNQLRKVQSNTLKIDKSFTLDIDEVAIQSSLIFSIVTVAKQQNMSVIAEGIETEKQLRILQTIGVEYGQGRLIADPMILNHLVKYSDQIS